MEFNADLVAVSAAGSDAPVHVLMKAEFAQKCQHQAARDLAVAAEQQLFSQDLFFHQDRAAEFLRVKDPELGRIPKLPDDPSLRLQLFQPEYASELTMWANHPSHYERERNAKRIYFRSPFDERPAWMLLRDQTALREEITRRFYRHSFNLDPELELTRPEVVAKSENLG
jgi:hypothetical protein